MDSGSTSATREWLEADGLGGFASGTADGIRTRRYHALLLPATAPPAGRVALVAGVEAWLETPGGTVALTSQRYAPDVVHPDGARRIESFAPDPWPRWRLRLPDGGAVEHELFVPRGCPAVALRWRRHAGGPGESTVLAVRPLLAARDYHALHHENAAFRFAPDRRGRCVVLSPYPGLPAISMLANGEYEHAPDWYRRFQYDEERARGLDHVEDLASPGVLRFDLGRQPAVLLLWAGAGEPPALGPDADPAALFEDLAAAELRRRRAFPTRLHRAADDYVVRRGDGLTVVAGYPWFVDWGRDTFIALRGLCLSAGRLDDARAILLQWAGSVSDGMLPNRFPDVGDEPEYNSVDASLWFVVAVHELLRSGVRIAARDRRTLEAAALAIVAGYTRGTRYGIRQDGDGLLAAGVPGVQLTWMDARVGDWVVTPRIGKPVEVQALWLSALDAARGLDPGHQAAFERARAAFEHRFWNEARGCLFDVVDAGGEPGRQDAALRPNQILAVGGLPRCWLSRRRARSVVDAVERDLLTPLGLRSLARGEPGYTARYQGGVLERDGAYHQGTVWPWLLGPFVEAWVRVRGGTARARARARARFLEPLLAHLGEAGLGHVSEIADAEPPHTPRGCPFQAWSVGEALRLAALLADTPTPPPGPLPSPQPQPDGARLP